MHLCFSAHLIGAIVTVGPKKFRWAPTFGDNPDECSHEAWNTGERFAMFHMSNSYLHMQIPFLYSMHKRQMTSRLLNQGILIVVYVCAVSFPVKKM